MRLIGKCGPSLQEELSVSVAILAAEIGHSKVEKVNMTDTVLLRDNSSY